MLFQNGKKLLYILFIFIYESLRIKKLEKFCFHFLQNNNFLKRIFFKPINLKNIFKNESFRFFSLFLFKKVLTPPKISVCVDYASSINYWFIFRIDSKKSFTKATINRSKKQ